MRSTILSLLVLALVPPVRAGDAFTQKPTVAPAVERGESPRVDTAAAVWDQHFAAGPSPSWIWGADQNKKYVLRKTFLKTSDGPTRLRATCDNQFTLFLNGKQIATSTEWQAPVEVDVTKLIARGENVLEAEVTNDGGPAGFLLKLVTVTGPDKAIYILSDDAWQANAKVNEKDGPPAKKLAGYGDQPWGKVFESSTAAQSGSKVPANTFVALPGFQVEKLFTVPKNELGSWVSLTVDDRGRLIASDQEGKGLVRITPGKVGTGEETRVEKIPAQVTAAQGLLWHNHALYVVCNGGPGSGLYRVTSSGGGDVLDKVEKLKAIGGGGEHGPHAVRLGPDGASLYVICGNHTQPPEKFAHSRLPRNWGEDHLLPRQWDANGHARGILAPGGYVARTDLGGTRWEIVTSGYRNPYDFAFNADGEMFVYDADMEWDMGMPWYRPTRVNHATSGSELGWRSGTGKWPAYYVDSLPAMVDIGPGSPVGVEFGYGAKFPAKYQTALFCCDWTFGTIYALHLEPGGATYKAAKEEFLSRTPLPLTDLVINPADGAMYFITGGRGAQSELFRVTYVGKESTRKVSYGDGRGASARLTRKELEEYHRPAADPAAVVKFAYPLLGDPDRFIRYAARIALEHQPVNLWQEDVLRETDKHRLIGGAVALARQGDKALQPRLLDALGKLEFAKLSEAEQLDLLRAYQLVFIRMGEPDKDAAAALARRFDPLFPANSDFVNRELVQLLVYLKSPTIVEKVCAELKKPSKPLTAEGLEDLLNRNRGYGGGIAAMLKNGADQQKLAYFFTLRNAPAGWNMDRWRTYYGFLAEARTKNGGASYQGFLTNIEKDAFARATDAERLAIEAAKLRPAFKPKELPRPIGPGKEWTTAELVDLEAGLKTGRNFKNGERAYAAARCIVCHRFGGDGGATGPDLSQVAGRFTLKDLAESIVEPSKVVSDQYKASVIRTTDDKTITGKIVSEVNGRYTVVLDPEDSTKVIELKKEDVADIKPSNISLMPEKLLAGLNETEVLDLLAYLLSRGDPNHPIFKK